MTLPGMMMLRVSGRARGGLGLALLGLAVSVLAQTPDNPLSPEAATVPQLESIVVTGESGTGLARAVSMGALGSQKILDTPFSIHSVDAAHLRERQASFLDEAFREDPSFSAPSAGYGTVRQFSIRGFGMGSRANYRRNGLAFMHFAESPFESVERLDLLKGLSGFAYGFTSPGGVVNFIPKKPTGQPHLAATVGYTSDSMWRGHLDAGGRFGPDDKLGYRLNVALEQGETPIRHMDMRRHVLSAYLDWRVTRDFTLGLDVEHSRLKPQGMNIYSYSLAPGVAVPRPPKLSQFNGVEAAGYDTISTLLGVNADWVINRNWSASANFLHHSFRRDAWFPLARIVNDQGDMIVTPQRDAVQAYPMRSAQMQLVGNVALFGMRHELMLGADWAQKESWRGDYAFAPAFASNLYDSVAAPVAAIHAVRDRYQNAENNEMGAFFTDTIHISDQWHIMAGLRYARLKVENYHYTGTRTSRYKTSATTPMFALIFKPVPDMTLYASWAQGLEQGGTAPVTAANAGRAFGALKSEQTELGAKWQASADWWLTAAVFHVDKGLGYTDPATNLYSQQGKRVHKGLELMIDGKLTRHLRLVSGLMWLDATMKKTGNPLVNGRRPTDLPKHTLTALLEYEVPVVPGLGASVGWRRIGNRAYNATNTVRVSGHSLFNAGLHWRTKRSGALTVIRANVENLTNKRYWGNASSGLQPGVPRTVKLSLETQF